MAGGWCEDDGLVAEVGMLEVDASAFPVVGSSEDIVCSMGGGAWDGSMGSDRIGMGCSGVNRIPRWC